MNEMYDDRQMNYMYISKCHKSTSQVHVDMIKLCIDIVYYMSVDVKPIASPIHAGNIWSMLENFRKFTQSNSIPSYMLHVDMLHVEHIALIKIYGKKQ